MAKEDAIDMVTTTIRKHMDLPDDEIIPVNQNLYDIGFDDLDFLEVTMMLEEELTSDLPDEDYETIQDFAEAIEDLL